MQYIHWYCSVCCSVSSSTTIGTNNRKMCRDFLSRLAHPHTHTAWLGPLWSDIPSMQIWMVVLLVVKILFFDIFYNFLDKLMKQNLKYLWLKCLPPFFLWILTCMILVYSSCLRSILSEGSSYMLSPIHCSFLPSFVLFSSIVMSWLSQTPSKYYTFNSR